MDDLVVLSRRERKKQNCRYAIIRAAQQNFEAKGIDGTSINDIANDADISYATFFNYFPSKDNLVLEICKEEFVDLAEFVRLKLSDEPSALRKIMELFTESMRDGIKYRRTSIRIYEVVPKELWTSLEFNYARKAFIDFVKEGQANGEIRSDLEPDNISLMISGIHDVSLINFCEEQKALELLYSLFEYIKTPETVNPLSK